jgi:hypothetical protein
MIVLDIDVTKLDRARFREGTKGQKYCDLVLIECKKEKSDGFVKQGVSKEERAARVEMPIIGNYRIIESRSSGPASSKPATPPTDEAW